MANPPKVTQLGLGMIDLSSSWQTLHTPGSPQTVPRGALLSASLQPPRRCNATCALCPTSALRVSMQLTLSRPECHTGHAQLPPLTLLSLALSHAYPWSGCSKVISTVPAGATAAWIQRIPGRVGRRGTPGDSPARGSGTPRLPMSSLALWVRWPRARGCAGRTRLRARAPVSARAARPGVRGSPTREGREPPRAAQSRFRARCLDAVAVAARAGGFPRAPAPSPPAPLLPPRSHTQNSLSAAPRVPTQSAAGSWRAGTCLQEPQSCRRARRLGGEDRCRGCLSESPAFQVAKSSVTLPGILASLTCQASFPPK